MRERPSVPEIRDLHLASKAATGELEGKVGGWRGQARGRNVKQNRRRQSKKILKIKKSAEHGDDISRADTESEDLRLLDGSASPRLRGVT